MTQVYFPDGRLQERHNNSGHHAFDIPLHLQNTVARVVVRLSESEDKFLSAAADSIRYHDYEDDKYTSNIYMRVDGNQYALYACDAMFRIGAGGENTSSFNLAQQDKAAILAYFSCFDQKFEAAG